MTIMARIVARVRTQIVVGQHERTGAARGHVPEHIPVRVPEHLVQSGLEASRDMAGRR